jgi:hypothetical protein
VRPGAQDLRRAVIVPTPGSARSVGASCWTSCARCASRAVVSTFSESARCPVMRRVVTVARSSAEWLGALRRRAHRRGIADGSGYRYRVAELRLQLTVDIRSRGLVLL